MKNRNDIKETFLPKISVIFPVRNEEKFIGRTIEFIQKQNYPREKVELIVVDGCSEDATVEIVKNLRQRDSRIHLYTNPRKLSSAARNIGIRNSTGEIILFIDGHVFIDNDDLLLNIAKIMQEKNVAVLSRPQLLKPPDNSFFQNAVAYARESWLGHGLDSTIYSLEEKYVNPTSSGAAYKREVIEKVGYFDENFDAAEDVEFNYRVHVNGYRAFTSGKFIVYYYPRRTLPALFKQMKRYGYGRYQFMKKHKTDFSSGAALLLIFFLFLLILFFSGFLFPQAHFLVGMLFIFYLLAVLSESVRIGIKQGLLYSLIVPAIFPVIHLGLAYGMLAGILSDLSIYFKKLFRREKIQDSLRENISKGYK
jgi:glycosyltransferase involved in cell wall biosynthesis